MKSKPTSRLATKLVSLALALALLAAALPSSLVPAAAAAKDLQIAVLTDPHFYPTELTGDFNEAFQRSQTAFGKQHGNAEPLLLHALTAIEEHAKSNGLKYILVPGDLTKDGELEAHRKFARILEDFEKRTGIQVAVVPGNHDINNSDAEDFSSGQRMPGNRTSPEQFREIYKNLGFDLQGFTAYAPPAGAKGGMLSYAADLGDGYRLIALDVCRYSADQTDSGEDEHETGSRVRPELLAWALKEIKAARAAGKTVIGMAHHNLVPQAGPEERIFLDFMLEDWLRVREAFMDAGMHYYLSGHIHVNSVGYAVSDSGETLYDICGSSLTTFPNTFREIRFSGAGNSLKADVRTCEIDCLEPVTLRGVTYPAPYRAVSFAFSYGNDLSNFLVNMLDSALGGFFEGITAEGGLLAYLGTTSLDLEGLFDGLLGGGVQLAGVDIFTARNVVSLIGDILAQVDKIYIQDFGHLMDVLKPLIDSIVGMRISDVPSTRFYKDYGVGDPNRPGTLEDLAYSILLYLYGREPGAREDKFLQDTIARFDSGEEAEHLINLLLDAILNDVLQGELLPALELHVAPVFVRPLVRYTLGALLDGILRLVLLGDNSFQGVVDFVFRLGVLPWESLNGLVDSLYDDYWTDSQSEALGAQLATFFRRFTALDKEDNFDNDAVLRYTGKVKVTPTQAACQLPTLLNQTLGANATSRVITWYTKDAVRGTDLRLTDTLTGKSALKDVTVKARAEDVTLTYPGADLGIIGIFKVPVYLRRHTIELSGLRPRAEYTFQVGDAARGWWSPEGGIRTADGSKTTTFLSFTDPQAQLERQYARTWGKLTRAALKLYPETDLIVTGGDQVDSGESLEHWQYFFDTAQSALRRVPLMPTTGNHEEGSAALSQYFALPIPEQDEDSGVYYSYDYNNLHFIHLNTNDLEDDALSAAQLAWLEADAAASDADWKIVVLHKALYSNGSHYADSDVAALRAQLGALLPALGIDLAIQGHDHVYLRTGAMKDGKVLQTATETVTFEGKTYAALQDPEGTVFSIAGTSGVKLYNAQEPAVTDEYFPRAAALVDLGGPAFAAYTADNGTLYYDAYMMAEDGSLVSIDSFAIQKSGVEPFDPPEGWYDRPTPASKLFPDTGDAREIVIVAVPLALLLAAGYVLLAAKRRREEARL